MPKHGAHISHDMRVAILVLHWFTKKSWTEISTDLSVYPNTARLICMRAKGRAKDASSFTSVLASLDNQDRKGKGNPAKFPKGLEESRNLAELALRDEEHYRKPFPEIAKELGYVAARSTIEKVMHNHHGIFRYKGRKKPGLNQQHKDARLNFADMALHVRIQSIVFTDEMWVEFNSPRREGNVSRPKGSNPYDYAIHEEFNSNPIRLMFWGCIAFGFKGPCYIWEKETDDERIRHQGILHAENYRRRQIQAQRIALARISNTIENRILTEYNANVDRTNIREGRISRNKRRHRKPEHMDEFKMRELKWQSKGGINWVSYQQKVLHPLLYPFIDHIQKESGEPVIYLVEDNAPCHKTAQFIDADIRHQKGIITFNWPFKSPDLNKIEPIWDYEKDEIATYQFQGATQGTIESAKAALLKAWEDLPQEYINRMCMDFHNKCELVIENGGDNNFNG